MARLITSSALAACLMTTAAWGQGRVWVLPIDSRDGTWTEEPAGGYPGAHGGRYWWTQGFSGVTRAYWRFQGSSAVAGEGLTTEEPPDEPRLYFIRTWVPPANSHVFSPIEADTTWPHDQKVPWLGQFGTNTSWLTRNSSNQGNWVATGPGPQAPVAIQNSEGVWASPCNAGGSGMTLWLKRGDRLFVKMNFGFYGPNDRVGVSAVEITEANTVPPGFPPLPLCEAPAGYGPIDLRCLGNADPLYGIGASPWWDSPDNEPFANSHAKMIGRDDATLTAENYRLPCNALEGVTPGLPADGVYNVVFDPGSPRGTAEFKLRYDGLNTIKWDAGNNNPASPFYRHRMFTLNEAPDREFISGKYGKLHFLTVKNGGSNGELFVEAVYDDTTTDVFSFKLYDWFNTDGDETSQAVGVNGELRSSHDETLGFRRVNRDGISSSGGTHNGAFLFLHSADIDEGRILTQIRLWVAEDERGFGGSINIVAASFAPLSCNTPVFDVVGGGVDGLEPDGAVDMQDFGAFQACYTGPAGGYDPVACGCFDVNLDGLIDATDFVYFKACATGPAPGSPPPPGCDQP